MLSESFRIAVLNIVFSICHIASAASVISAIFGDNFSLVSPKYNNEKSTVVNALERSCSTPGPVSAGMGDCLQAGKPSRYVTNHLGQLSLPSLRSRKIEYRPVWLGLRAGRVHLIPYGK